MREGERCKGGGRNNLGLSEKRAGLETYRPISSTRIVQWKMTTEKKNLVGSATFKGPFWQNSLNK